MAPTRLLLLSVRPISRSLRSLNRSATRFYADDGAKERAQQRIHETTPGHRKAQTSKPLNPHMTNTDSTNANEMPSVGSDKAPPELLSSIDPDFTPKDRVPENTDRMTGHSQKGKPTDGPNAELGELEVGEMEGTKFKVEPLRRTGEDGNTMRARLLCSSIHLSYLSTQQQLTLSKS